MTPKNSILLAGTIALGVCGSCAYAQTAPPETPAATPTAAPVFRVAPPVPPAAAMPAVSAAAGEAATGAGAAAPVSVPDNYRLGTEDTISIEVLRHADVTRSVRIPADGRVRLLRLNAPLLVQGKTCAEVSDELTRRLQSEGKLRLRPGQVSVSVVAMRPRRVYVRGNAITGREMDLKNNWHISEMVAEMGGVPQPNRITATLQNADLSVRPEPIKVDLAEALGHPASPDNLLLKEGDTLILQAPQVKRLIVTGTGPLGAREMDERFGLRDSLNAAGYSATGATGDLRNATLWHHAIPGDPTSPVTAQPVDLFALLEDKTSPDYAYNDLDRLEIPVSKRFVSIQGATGGLKKITLPEDRKTFLSDVIAQTGTLGNAKIGEIYVRHYDDNQNMTSEKRYDYGKYISKGEQKQNPEILAGDMVFVPNVRHTDPNAITNGIVSGWGIFSIFKALIPGIR